MLLGGPFHSGGGGLDFVYPVYTHETPLDMWRIGSTTSKNEAHQGGATVSFMFRHCESSISFASVFYIMLSDKLVA